MEKKQLCTGLDQNQYNPKSTYEANIESIDGKILNLHEIKKQHPIGNKSIGKVELDNSVQSYTEFEPILDFRFIVNIKPVINECNAIIESYLINSIELPKFVNGRYQPITMKIYNAITPSPTPKLCKLIELLQRNTSSAAIFTVEISILGPAADVVEKWSIDVFDFDIDFGNFSYYSNDAAQQSITITNYKPTLLF